MCKSKAEGGQRCAAHGGSRKTKAAAQGIDVRRQRDQMPMMPYDYEPERGPVSRLLRPTLSDGDRRLFWYRSLGYQGPIDQDGFPA